MPKLKCKTNIASSTEEAIAAKKVSRWTERAGAKLMSQDSLITFFTAANICKQIFLHTQK